MHYLKQLIAERCVASFLLCQKKKKIQFKKCFVIFLRVYGSKFAGNEVKEDVSLTSHPPYELVILDYHWLQQEFGLAPGPGGSLPLRTGALRTACSAFPPFHPQSRSLTRCQIAALTCRLHTTVQRTCAKTLSGLPLS